MEADAAWLALPAVHYALMHGNQQPSFRLATGQHDTRHWLAWEVCPQCQLTSVTADLVLSIIWNSISLDLSFSRWR